METGRGEGVDPEEAGWEVETGGVTVCCDGEFETLSRICGYID